MSTPTMSRVSRPGAATKTLKSPAAKKKMAPPNQSILSFFKKVPPPDESMFVAGGSAAVAFSQCTVQREDGDVVEVAENVDVEMDVAVESVTEQRFNEFSAPVKRRRLSEEHEKNEPPPLVPQSADKPMASNLPKPAKQPQKRGPFLDDSDSDDDEDVEIKVTSPGAMSTPAPNNGRRAPLGHGTVSPPHLSEHYTSFEEAFRPLESKAAPDQVAVEENDYDDFLQIDGDEDDDFEGEEYREKIYMEEQAWLEAADILSRSYGCDDSGLGNNTGTVNAEADVMAECCPICGASLAGCTPDQATVHVNACLDGGTPPADSRREPFAAGDSQSAPTERARQDSRNSSDTSADQKQPISGLSKRFMRTAQPRPGQANPIAIDSSGLGGLSSAGSGGSAFAKLMSGHAEDAAWATAAAAEFAARGRPAYERTCPFYKIMPGFFICVDAFRYGAVEGCRAYFLSHFHSDHYVGLTAKWCHGPIYCSQVTGSLVKSQLGTAAKWVVELPFDETVDVPGTEGVRVTMLPANHCPGSSLFLFEKTLSVPGGSSGNKRTQRILHCGDFRACPAQVQHPLLRPETVDVVTGKTRQQKIDVCYLDTTYLNPRYSFPPQDDVIGACAALCAELDRSLRAGRELEWDRTLRRRENGSAADGSGNVRDFFTKGTDKSNTPEEDAISAGERPFAPPLPPPENALLALGKPSKSPDRNRLLVVCGTYSIGKERICKAVAQALGTKIFASPAKIKIVAQLGDPELTALMTSDATEAQVHMQMLMEIRAETLAEYLDGYRTHFAKIVGFRPSGWNYRPGMANSGGAGAADAGAGGGGGGGAGKSAAGPPAVVASASLAPSSLPTTALLHGPGWRTRFGTRDLVPQRGSTRESLCFGVPYSEHSSFRELALFLLALRIEKVVPTVNVGSAATRKRMKGWIDRWLAERRRGGLVRMRPEEASGPGTTSNGKEIKLWDGKDGTGGTADW